MNPEELNKIIKGCVKRKRKSQEALFQTFAPKMFSICLYYSNNRDEAQDLLQDGFIKVFDKISQFKAKGSFEGWLRRVFTTTALEQFRKRKLILEEDTNINTENRNTNEDIISKISADELINIIQELSPAYRMVFNLYALEGYSHKEISERLNISVGTSKSNLSRARNILKERVSNRLKLKDR